jgi:AraC-like DNA-binding protein
MIGAVQNVEQSSDPELRYWRDPALEGACLARARYGAHKFERHVHDEMVIAVTEAGAGRCRTRFGSDISGPETVWVFAPGEYHCGHVWEDRRWYYRGIYLDHLGLAALAGVLSAKTGASHWVRPGLYADAQLAQLLIRAHCGLGQNASHLERQAQWWVALGMLFGRYGQPRPQLEACGNERSRMALLRDYIAANYTRNISAEELSRVCGLSRYHLMRSFAREYGLPPHAYANQLRLVAAKRLIMQGERPAAAAATVGFYDQSHLTRLFKRAYGITPGAYAGLQARSSQPS